MGEVTIHDRTPLDEIVARCQGAEAILTNKTPVTRSTIEQLPRLRYIGVLATGFNIVNVEAAAQRGIPVTNVPTYGTQSVVQMVFAHLLHHALHLADHSSAVRGGAWTRSSDFCFWNFPLMELAGKTMGIVGLGRIGQATARVALALGMNVLASDVRLPQTFPEGVRGVDLETLFQESDVVSLHCPLTPETEKLVNRDRLALMKPSAWLINTSRGPLVDETALAEALNAQRIGGAGLDVLASEPPSSDNPLLSARNCTITPHIAWATAEARKRLLDTVVANLRAFVDGQPQNVVNGVG